VKWKGARPSVYDEVDLKETQERLDKAIRMHLRYSFWDLFMALLFAFFINSAILIVFAANFFYGAQTIVGDLFEAHSLLQQYLGSAAAVIFALALLFSGQSSTLTATLAGQIVMSGFLGMTSRPWVRRIVTRLIAIIPAMVAAAVAGREGLSNMLIASQVALSIQLPFAVVPLVIFTGMDRVMSISVYNDSKEDKYPETADAEDGDDVSDDQKRKSDRNDTMSTAERSVASKAIHETQEAALEMDIMTTASSDTGSESKTSQAYIEDAETAISEVEPLMYANNRIMNAVSVIVSLIIIGLNAYLVITLFMGKTD
jgi:metal iron transporter